MRKIYISLILLLVCGSSYSQSLCRLLGKKIGELRFAAEREGVELGPEVDVGDGRTMMVFKSKKSKKGKIDLGVSNLLFFKPARGEECYMITSMPSTNAKWVADTLIERLVKKGFKQRDTNTFFSSQSGCVAYFESVPLVDEKGKSLGINTLRLTYYLEQ